MGTGCLRNLTPGGDDPPRQFGKKHRLGKKHSLDTLVKLSVAKTGKPGNNRGRTWKHKQPRSAEHCAKLSRALTGRVQQPIIRSKVSEGLKKAWAEGKFATRKPQELT